ncbi:transposase [Thomasclavelia ramosa]|uniref:transposase n=1 Tax=Thomasclavelia ramosa TaxID=1547 RepID=UPI0036F1BA42
MVQCHKLIILKERYMTMSKPSFTDEQGVVQYVLDHPDESKLSVAKQFGIADSTVHKWLKDAQSNNGTIISRGSGNYASDEAKEIAKLTVLNLMLKKVEMVV